MDYSFTQELIDLAAPLIGLAVIAYPTWRIIKRTGLNQYWTLLLLIPGFGWLIILVMLSNAEWPISSKGDA